MRKTTTSKKGAKEEMKKNYKFDQARSKKRSVELKKFFFDSFLPLRAPERHPRRWGAAEGDNVCSRGKTAISEKKCARA